MPEPPPYAELHCLSNFSFLRGASHPEELIEQAATLGYTALALTDACSLAGIVRAHVAAKEHGLQLIVGSELRLDDGLRLILLARNAQGYANLARLITRARRRSPKGEYSVMRADIEDGSAECLVLWAPSYAPAPQTEDEKAATWLAQEFPGRAWIAVELHRGAHDRAHTTRLERLAVAHDLPLVAAGDVHMHRRARRRLQDLLTAIRLGVPLAEAGYALYPNGERHLRSRAQLAALYQRKWIEESTRIAGLCDFSLDALRYAYPSDDVPPGETPSAYLRRLTEAGLRERWPQAAPEKVRELVEHELSIIAELGYEPYFLTVYDLVRFARARGILCQGRGSAANSAVCYCLGITSVDPGRMEMLFERFVSKERDEPPDIDVDFEHERREEVMQYLFEKYGRERAALAATVITYRRRSALRDAGKALGFAPEQLDRLAGNLAWWEDGIETARIREAGLDPDSAQLHRLLRCVDQLRGFPRHLSQHVGGFVLCEGRLSELVPIENAAMPERTVIQWDKDDLDAIGLLKVDVLALGMLSAIRRCFALIAHHRGQALMLADVPAEDPATYAMIQRADTVGVFQIESRAQMSMLPRLRPACFYDLVIEVAIVRPGPIQGQMVHPFLKRRRGIEPVRYPSEAVRGVLARTLGVPIFQEQVIKLAMVAAGFSAGEADGLRRAIGTWRKRGTLDRFRERLLKGMRVRGYDPSFAEQIYQQILGFGEYGFPESHSASFALLAYVSAWLKCHEPAAFACALLNSQPMGFYAPAQLVQDARRHGVEVRATDVRMSEWDCTLEPTQGDALALRLGLRMLKGLSRIAAERLLRARATRAFIDVEDLAHRAAVDRRDLEALAAGDALAGLSGHRHRARWDALGVEETLPLFEGAEGAEATPMLRAPREGEEIVADYASLGLSLRRHPLELLEKQLAPLRDLRLADLAQAGNGQRLAVVGLVITRQHPASANGTVFLTLEDETGSANLIVWPQLVQRQRAEVVGARLLRAAGKITREGESVHLIAERLEDHSRLLGDLLTPSRDFR